MKLAAIALVVACLLAGCNTSTPTPVPPATAGSPAARVDAPPPANGVPAPPTSSEPAPSASAAPRPTPTPDPETVRKAAAAQYLAANVQAVEAFATKHKKAGDDAAIWGQFAADLKKLQVPADTAADLHDLTRRIVRVQALDLEESGHFARMDDFYTVARHLRNARSRMAAAVDRVRSDLGLPALCRAGCSGPEPVG